MTLKGAGGKKGTIKIIIIIIFLFISLVGGLIIYSTGSIVFKHFSKKYEEMQSKAYLLTVPNKALNYYKNKYGIDQKVSNVKVIENTPSSCIFGCKPYEAYRSILLENGDEIIYDVQNKKFYDDHQYKLIEKDIQELYMNKLLSMVNEIKADNELSKFSNYDNFITINNAIADDVSGKFQKNNVFYFHEFYDGNVEEYIDKEPIKFNRSTLTILCDKSSKCNDIVANYYNSLKKADIAIKIYELTDNFMTRPIAYYSGDNIITFKFIKILQGLEVSSMNNITLEDGDIIMQEVTENTKIMNKINNAENSSKKVIITSPIYKVKFSNNLKSILSKDNNLKLFIRKDDRIYNDILFEYNPNEDYNYDIFQDNMNYGRKLNESSYYFFGKAE